MAIHDGVVWSRAAAKAVDRGNCLGGTFGGKCSFAGVAGVDRLVPKAMAGAPSDRVRENAMHLRVYSCAS